MRLSKLSFLLTASAVGTCLCVPLAHMQDANSGATVQPHEEFSTARVIGILGEDENDDYGTKQTTQHLQLRILSGPEAGKEFVTDNGVINNRADMKLSVGSTVVLDKTYKSDGEVLYLIKEAYRLPAMIWLTLLFVALTILLGRLTGITSIVGLIASIVILIFFVIPRIVAGDNPLHVCLIGAAAIACSSLYLAHGFNKRTSVALLSTLVTLVFAALAAIFYVFTAHLFGMGSEDSLYLQTGPLQNLDLRGLLLGGIIIGCLGVLDDVTTAQCASVEEISKANPLLTSAQLRKAGFSIGREHIASLINTLALAYAGASLPLLLLFKTQDTYPLWVTLNGEFLAEEIVRTLVGSITLVAAVPVATYFASRLLRAKKGQVASTPSGHSHVHHH